MPLTKYNQITNAILIIRFFVQSPGNVLTLTSSNLLLFHAYINKQKAQYLCENITLTHILCKIGLQYT